MKLRKKLIMHSFSSSSRIWSKCSRWKVDLPSLGSGSDWHRSSSFAPFVLQLVPLRASLGHSLTRPLGRIGYPWWNSTWGCMVPPLVVWCSSPPHGRTDDSWSRQHRLVSPTSGWSALATYGSNPPLRKRYVHPQGIATFAQNSWSYDTSPAGSPNRMVAIQLDTHT